MSRKRYTPEQIISMLREAEVALAQGQSVGQACRTLGVSEQSYYRWRKEYGGLRTDQAGGSARWASKMVPAKHESKTARACLASASRTNSPKRLSDSAASLSFKRSRTTWL